MRNWEYNVSKEQGTLAKVLLQELYDQFQATVEQNNIPSMTTLFEKLDNIETVENYLYNNCVTLIIQLPLESSDNE